MQIIETTHWSVGSPFASFSAHEKAPLCSQQYVSTATVCPRYFFTFMGSEASLINCNRPWIPMSSVWMDRCLRCMVYERPVCANLSNENKSLWSSLIIDVTLYRYWRHPHDPLYNIINILKSQQKTFPNRPTTTNIVNKWLINIYIQ